MERYPSVKSGRFHIQTSRGCPHRCGFCYNGLFNKNKWRAKRAERVLDEIEYVLEKFPQVKIIDPIDDNFFVDEERVKQICNGILDRGNLTFNGEPIADLTTCQLMTRGSLNFWRSQDVLSLILEANRVQSICKSSSAKTLQRSKCCSRLRILSAGRRQLSLMFHG